MMMITFGHHHTARILNAYFVWAKQRGLMFNDPESIKKYNKFLLIDNCIQPRPRLRAD